MIYYPISAFINAAVSIILGLLVLYKNPRSKLNRAVFFWCFTGFFWAAFYFVWLIQTESAKALLWQRMLHLGAVWVPIAYFKVVTTFLEIEREQRNLTYFGYFLAVFFSCLLTTPLMLENVRPIAGFLFWPKAGLAYAPFLVMFLGFTFYGLYLSIRALKTSSPLKRAQIKFMLFGMVISIIGGSTNYFLCYSIPIMPYGNIFASTYVLFTVYAIIKKGLFNIKMVLTELLVALIGLILFAQIFILENPQTKIIGSVIFILFCFTGYLLIRSTHQEIKKEQEAERLAGDLNNLNKTLEKKVQEKTYELQTSVSELERSKKALLNILDDIEKVRQELEENKIVLEIKVRARTRELEELASSLDEQVKKRTEELEEKMKDLKRFQSLSVDRELKMIELKKEIKKIKDATTNQTI